MLLSATAPRQTKSSGFIEALFEEELKAALGRRRCERAVGAPRGYPNGTRERHLLGGFGPVQVSVPRARMAEAEGGTREWLSSARRCAAPLQVTGIISTMLLSSLAMTTILSAR